MATSREEIIRAILDALTDRHNAAYTRYRQRLETMLAGIDPHQVDQRTRLYREAVELMDHLGQGIGDLSYETFAEIAENLGLERSQAGWDYDDADRPSTTAKTDLAAAVRSFRSHDESETAEALQELIDDLDRIARSAGQNVSNKAIIDAAYRTPGCRVVGARRIIHPELSRGGACGLCVAAADRVYKTRDLKPVHPNCRCGVLPIIKTTATGKVVDIGDELNRGDYERLSAARVSGNGSDQSELSNLRVYRDDTGDLIISRNTGSTSQRDQEHQHDHGHKDNSETSSERGHRNRSDTFTSGVVDSPSVGEVWIGAPSPIGTVIDPSFDAVKFTSDIVFDHNMVVCEPVPGVGRVFIPRFERTYAHERLTAARLARLHHDVRFQPTTRLMKNPDVLLDGIVWELKTPDGKSQKHTIRNIFRKAKSQTVRLCIDLVRIGLPEAVALAQIKRKFNHQSVIQEIMVLGASGHVVYHATKTR